MRQYPGPGGMGGAHLLFGFIGFLGTLVVLGLLTLLVVYLVKRAGQKNGPAAMSHHHNQPHHAMPPALQVLDERLARGDIDVEDYLNRRAALTGQAEPPREWTPPAPPAGGPTTEEPSI